MTSTKFKTRFGTEHENDHTFKLNINGEEQHTGLNIGERLDVIDDGKEHIRMRQGKKNTYATAPINPPQAPILPPAVDLTTDPCMPSIGNQGQQGSCAAFAMTHTAMGYQCAKANNWTDASLGNKAHLLSPAWTYNRVNGGNDSGTFMDTIANIHLNWGCATEAQEPYVASNITNWGTESAQRQAPLYKASAIVNMATNSPTLITDIKTKISESIPVTFAMDAGQFNKFDSYYMFTTALYNSNTVNHAACAVAYDDNKVNPNYPGEIGAFKVANSWGTGYCLGGYYWISYATITSMNAKGLLFPIYSIYENSQPRLLANYSFTSGSAYRVPTVKFNLMNAAGTTISNKTMPYTKQSPYAVGKCIFPNPTIMDITELFPSFSTTNNVFNSVFSYTGTIVNGPETKYTIEEYDTVYTPGVPMATAINTTTNNIPFNISVTLTGITPPVYTVPDAPTALSGVAGTTTATLSWVAPVNNGGTPITGYGVYVNGVKTLTSAGTSMVISGLTQSTTYQISVTAINAIGESVKSTAISITTLTPPPVYTVPGPPINVMGIAGNSQIGITWVAPTNNGGTPIIGYNIYVNGNKAISVTGTGIVISGLTNGTTYTVNVSAVNSVGEGAKSTSVVLTPTGPGVIVYPNGYVVGNIVKLIGYSWKTVGTQKVITSLTYTSVNGMSAIYYKVNGGSYALFPATGGVYLNPGDVFTSFGVDKKNNASTLFSKTI